jgi:hypothetical protein
MIVSMGFKSIYQMAPVQHAFHLQCQILLLMNVLQLSYNHVSLAFRSTWLMALAQPVFNP